MANYNLINNVVAIATQFAAELGTSQTQFTLDNIDQMRAKVSKDHWSLLTELERSDDLGHNLANSIINNLFKLTFSNVMKAWISSSNEITVTLKNDVTIKIKNPAQREQEEELPW